MSDLDKLEKKYEKGDKSKDIRQSIAKLKETPSNPDTKRSFERRKETLDSVVRAVKQATAGFKSQWSGLDDEGRVGMGKGTPGIYYNTVAIPAIASVVDEKYAPDFAVAADKKAGKIKEAVRKNMGINEPKGALEHFAYAGGEMLGQLPVPGALMNKIVSSAKKMGMAGKVAAAPVEYLSPTVDPRALNYGIGTTFGGTMGTVGEALSEEDPVKKALGGLIQKYEDGGKVGKVATFFSAVDKAINTLKQKKGTGEQILKQLETTPGIKPEELESRGIKQKLMASPKITQEELQKTIKANKPPIPKRIKLGQGVDPEWQPRLEKRFQNALEELNIQPVVSPNDGKALGFYHPETGEILSASDVRNMDPQQLGIPVHPETGKLDPEDAYLLQNIRRAAVEAEEQFDLALEKTHTKFSQYSKSKGQNNYREILLQNQEDRVPGAGAMGQRIDELMKSTPATDEEAAAVNKEIDSLLDRLSMTRQQFTASHYDQPDVLAHYRVSDMEGPNGEKVLYVDEIQSDWHQKGRDARKSEIKERLNSERSALRQKALDEVGATDFTNENKTKITSVFNRLMKERKAQLEQEVPEEAGYRTAEDSQKLRQLNEKVQRIRDEGLSYNEIQEYFTPGKIVNSRGDQDKVLSFNSGESSPAFKIAYERKLEQAMNAGVSEEVASNWAKKRALDEVRDNWSVTVIEVDPKTGEPRKGAQPRTHMTSPENDIKNQLTQEAGKIERKVPDAPFKKNWHELAVKDILDLAAKEGYDKVAFSPGIEQINRYSQGLRQAVDSIEFSPTADGYLLVQGKKGDRVVFDGKALEDTFVSGAADGKTLSEVFGGQIARDIEAQAQALASQVGPETKKITPFGRQPMPEMSADELLYSNYEALDLEQRNWLERFVHDWEQGVDDTPAGQGIQAELEQRYNTWLAQNTLGPNSEEIAIEYGLRPSLVSGIMSRAGPNANLADLNDMLQYAGTRERNTIFESLDENEQEAAQRFLKDIIAERSPTASAPIGKIEGENLTVGGEGMKSFYDQRLPSYVKNYAGKEFKAPTGYLEVKGKVVPKSWTTRDLENEIQSINEADPMELMEMSQDIAHRRATEALERRGIRQEGMRPDDYDNELWDEMDNHTDTAYEQALRALAERNLMERAGKANTLRAFSVDITPQMKEKITTEGQKLFAATPAIGLGAAQLPQQMLPTAPVAAPAPVPAPAEEEQPKDPPTAPQGFQEGGRVGKLKEASEKVLRVLHGGPSRIRLDREKNLDVTTDQGYAIKRAQDKMSQMGQVGPPMVNKFDVPAAKMLRFEETYSPEDVKLMRRFFGKLPEGKAMTGEEIYDMAGGKDFVMEGIAKAGGMAGYERPAGGSGGVGNWYRVTDQEALTRKARGGLAQMKGVR